MVLFVLLDVVRCSLCCLLLVMLCVNVDGIGVGIVCIVFDGVVYDVDGVVIVVIAVFITYPVKASARNNTKSTSNGRINTINARQLQHKY